MYKNNSRNNSKLNGCSPLQLSCILTGMKPAICYYSYTNRWQKCLRPLESRYRAPIQAIFCQRPRSTTAIPNPFAIFSDILI